MLSEDICHRVLGRLGMFVAPAADMEGLRKLYSAWCASVPFDNVRKMIALRSWPGRPLPGIDAGDFFENWLAHGTGGTCWPTSNALYELARSLGFEASRVAGCMRDLGIVSHASVQVRADGATWLIDSSMLTNIPIPLNEEIFIVRDPVIPTEVEPVDGTHLLWFTNPPNPAALPCRLLPGDVDHAFYAGGYERSRERSPFNQRLYARRNFPGEIRILFGHTRFSKTRDGLEQCDLSPEEVCAALRSDIGLSEEIVESWVLSGCLDASFEPASDPKPPAEIRKPPSQR